MADQNIIPFPPPCQVGRNEGARCIMAAEIASQRQSIEDLKETHSTALERIESKVEKVDGKFTTLILTLLGFSATAVMAAIGWAVVLAKK